MLRAFKSEKGEVMLEGIIVYVVVLMLFFTILGFMNVIYQHWNMQIVAEDVATKVAQNYKNLDADLNLGASSYKSDEMAPYRYVLSSGEENMDRSAESRGESYAINRLKKTTFASSRSEPTVKVELISDTLASRHIEVTIENTYTIPFLDFLVAVGFPDMGHITVTASAQCYDILDYINTIDFVKSVASLENLNSKAISAIDKVWKAITTIVK